MGKIVIKDDFDFISYLLPISTLVVVRSQAGNGVVLRAYVLDGS